MTEFLLALAAFLAAHLLPSIPGLRSKLVARWGRGAYLAVYSAVSLALLGWVVVAARRADVVMLWEPAAWQWLTPVVVMPFALFLIVAGLSEPNPLSITWRKGETPGPVSAITRHPVLWGFLLWAAAHVPANGRLVPVILFGVMAGFSAAGFVLLDRKARRRLGPGRWRELARKSSLIPFAAMIAGRTRPARLAGLVGPAILTAILYLWFILQGHALLIGPDPLAGLHAFFG